MSKLLKKEGSFFQINSKPKFIIAQKVNELRKVFFG